MFFPQYPGRQDIRRIIIEDGNHGLDNDRSRIHAFIDKVNRAAAPFNPIVNRLLLDMQPRKGGQQGRMDIHHPPGKGT